MYFVLGQHFAVCRQEVYFTKRTGLDLQVNQVVIET